MTDQPPVTLTQVACELDCTPQLLKKWYPTQCARIVQRAKDKNIDWVTIEHALQEAMQLQSPPFPSVNELARQFGAPDQALRTRFPDICRTLSARYQMKYWATVQQQLEEILTEESPPSLEEVSRQLGCSASILKWRFPELCQEIVQRYAAFRQERSWQRKQQLCEEIQQVVRDLHEQGIYPNKAKTQRYMNKPMVFMEPTCSEAWRAAMKELGYSIDDDEQSTDESTS
jgi:AraC-like DNA-binding protein